VLPFADTRKAVRRPRMRLPLGTLALAVTAIVVVGLDQDTETEGEDRLTMRLPGRQGGGGGAEREKVSSTHAYFPWHAFWSFVSRKGANGHPT
jgi:hypothetical protein